MTGDLASLKLLTWKMLMNHQKELEIYFAELQRRIQEKTTTTEARISDDELWARFVDICDPLLHRFAQRCGVAQSDTNDVVQDVWYQLLLRIPKLQFHPEKGRLSTFLYSIMRNHVVDRMRRNRRCLATVWLNDDQIADQQVHPHNELSSSNSAEQTLEKVMRDTTEVNRNLVELLWKRRESACQVAQQLGITIEQVYYRSYRLKRRFKTMYNELRSN